MIAEANKAAKRRYFEAFNARNLDTIDDLFAPEYVLHIPGSPDIEGPERVKQMVAGSLASLSEPILTVDDMFGEGDKVATRWTLTAIHSGEFLGISPTNRRITMQGVIIDRFVNGKVVEGWECFDMYGLMAQLGKIPPDE